MKIKSCNGMQGLVYILWTETIPLTVLEQKPRKVRKRGMWISRRKAFQAEEK